MPNPTVRDYLDRLRGKRLYERALGNRAGVARTTALAWHHGAMYARYDLRHAHTNGQAR